MRCRFPVLLLASLVIIGCSPPTKTLTFYDGHVSLRVPPTWSTSVEGSSKQISTPGGDLVLTLALFVKEGGLQGDFSKACFAGIDASVWTEATDKVFSPRSRYAMDFRTYVDTTGARRTTVVAMSKDKFFLSLTFVSGQGSFAADSKVMARVVSDLQLL